MDIIQYSKDRRQKVEDLVQMVISGDLTADEAAQSLAGWEMKNGPENKQYQEGHFNREQAMENLIQKCRMDIDSRLPGFDGIVPGRHI